MNFISNPGYVMVCITGLTLIIKDSIGYGVIVAFIVYIKKFDQLVAEITNIITRMQSVASVSEKMFEVLSTDEMKPFPPIYKIGRSNGHVEFRDVRFGYTPERKIIHRFSLDIRPGSRVTIINPMDTDKTMFVSLLMRFYNPDSERS